MLRVRERLKVVVPLTLVLIFVLLYMNTRSAVQGGHRDAGGALLGRSARSGCSGLLGYNVSIAAWVGMIALMGLDAETGVFMLLFLDLSYDEASARDGCAPRRDLDEAIVHGAVKRVRPKLMTVRRPSWASCRSCGPPARAPT